MTAPIRAGSEKTNILMRSDVLAWPIASRIGVAASSGRTISERDAIETPGLGGVWEFATRRNASRAPGRCKTCGARPPPRGPLGWFDRAAADAPPTIRPDDIRHSGAGSPRPQTAPRTRLRPAGEAVSPDDAAPRQTWRAATARACIRR